MDVVFGLFVDSGAVPDHSGIGPGTLGDPVVGPLGLVGLLETALGLGGPPTAQVMRVARFQAVLEALDGGYFWTASLAMDPWATARNLLRWRDELIGFGWDGNREWMAPRLADLAAASRASSGVAPGLQDRIAALLGRLETRRGSPIARLRVIDDQEVLPAPLRRLVACLASRGTVIEKIEARASATTGSALGQLQRWMLGEDLAGAPDGSITIARASSGPLAAELIGQWFANAPPGRLALVAQDSDTALLDHGLACAGEPRAGRSRPSPHRGSLQLLLLAFKCSWQPFDPSALMELLVFPGSPIASRAGRRLAAALEEAPGRGGETWREAWAAIDADEQARAAGDAKAMADIAPRIARWRAWAEPRVVDPVTGMPVEQALAICDRVAAWATRRHASFSDPLYLMTASLANDVRGALAAIGRPLLPRTLVERVIDQALDIGHANPLATAEAADWRSAAHPGAVWQPSATVIWWRFGHTNEGTARSPWSAAERAELAAAGCPVDELTLEGRAASAGWERAVLNASERILFLSLGLGCEADEASHPLAHRLAPGLARLADSVRLEEALAIPAMTFAGVSIPRAPIPRAALPAENPTWVTPAGFVARRDAMTESATSLEALLSCQLMWALRHVARLRPGRVRSIPDANQLLGNLAHAIAREVFPPGAPPTPEEAEAHTRSLLEGRIDQLAAPLRLPQLAEELSFARRRLPLAMAALARTLHDNNLTVEATELQVSGTFETILALRGAVDLVARDAQGRAVIVDLKWSGSPKRRIEELKQGKAVQLATYGALVADGAPYRAGYYLLNQRQFATLDGSGLVGRAVEGIRSFPETWAAIVEAWHLWRGSADAGLLVASGVAGFEDHVPSGLPIEREVKCEWCDYQTLCRVRGLA